MRPVCARCGRPLRACLCSCIRAASSPVQLLILQHPSEADHAKGTVRLLELCLPGTTVVRGETFDPDCVAGPRTPVLVYPGGEPTLPDALPPDRLRLVLLDGTWRKSRLLLHRNPWLAALPRLSLPDAPPSGYAIRRAQAAGQLSTLEAAAHALGRFDGGATAPLLEAFAAFMALSLHAPGAGAEAAAPAHPGQRPDFRG